VTRKTVFYGKPVKGLIFLEKLAIERAVPVWPRPARFFLFWARGGAV